MLHYFCKLIANCLCALSIWWKQLPESGESEPNFNVTQWAGYKASVSRVELQIKVKMSIIVTFNWIKGEVSWYLSSALVCKEQLAGWFRILTLGLLWLWWAGANWLKVLNLRSTPFSRWMWKQIFSRQESVRASFCTAKVNQQAKHIQEWRRTLIWNTLCQFVHKTSPRMLFNVPHCHLWVFLFNAYHFWGSLAFLKYTPDVFVSTWQQKAVTKPFVVFLKIISHSFPVKSLFILSHRAVTNHPHLAELCSRASLTCCRSTTAVQPSVSTWNELQLKAVFFLLPSTVGIQNKIPSLKRVRIF